MEHKANTFNNLTDASTVLIELAILLDKENESISVT